MGISMSTVNISHGYILRGHSQGNFNVHCEIVAGEQFEGTSPRILQCPL